jgi:biotin carboxyl carrier protein
MLVAFAATLANYVLGAAIFLQAEGIVLRPVKVVAAPYDAHVRQIEVRPGQAVEAGSRLASLQSAAMMRRLSELVSQQTNLRTRIAQVESRLGVVTTLLPFARKREEEATQFRDRVRSLAERGNANAARLEETALAQYNAAERRIALNAELAALRKELHEARDMLAETNRTFAKLSQIYNEGEIVSPAAGTVGPTIASEGEVLLTGKPLLAVYSGQRYVLAFLPDEYLFGVRRGESVMVSAGSNVAVGTIEEVLPVTDRLPPEFRTAFRARGRNRLIRIGLSGAFNFAIQQQVKVTSCLSTGCESASVLLASLLHRVLGVPASAGLQRQPIVDRLPLFSAPIRPRRGEAGRRGRTE